ncbi:MAG: hypothetical protein V4454_02815 [Pseudomonadota bacterium]
MKDFIGLLKRGVLRIMTATLLLGTGMAFAASASGDGMRRTADIRYGDDARQRRDVYLPSQPVFPAGQAPVIVMVHGGAWVIGDKAMSNVTDNKVDSEAGHGSL